MNMYQLKMIYFFPMAIKLESMMQLGRCFERINAPFYIKNDFF